MSCTQTLANIAKPCGNGKGGLRSTVYVALRSAVNFDDMTYVETAKPYNTIQTLTASTWYKFEFGKNAADFTSEAQYDGTTGEFSYFKNTLNISFRKMDASLRLSINALLADECVVVFQDGNGVNYVLGIEEPVTSESCTHTTGTAKTDSNMVSIALSDTTAELPLHLSETALETIRQSFES